ncbi:GNAT family N-acetyltransferase [Granulosicoccus sp. 3-233]|uniref:GNAT family N-acetyltransferase n=1 Tax=Granulosicoccus sp. 3-233 TaxID=3417969 RepID=UPI003D343C13
MYTFRTGTPSDASRCHDIERSAYEGDEAATLEKITQRLETYPEGFLVLEIDGELAGFINCGCAHDVEMADEAFKELIGHSPEAPNVVILSVVVDPAYQGQSLSTALMKEFIGRMIDMDKQSIHLMCRQRHVPLYERFGFSYIRPSQSDHGGMTWHEMLMTL